MYRASGFPWGLFYRLSFIAYVIASLVCLYRALSSKAYRVHDSGGIIVSGASKGIGLAAAQHLAREGPQFVVFAGVRRAEDAAAIAALGLPNLLPLTLDVNNGSSVVFAVAEAMAELGRRGDLPLVAIVNNAGVARGPLPIEFHDAADAAALFETNFFGALRLTQAALPALRESSGRIIQVSSVFGRLAPPLGGVYAASKFALEAMSDSLRVELAAAGVSVSVVEPGAVHTPMFADVGGAASIARAVEAGTPASKVYPQFHTAADVANEVRLEALAEDVAVTSAAIRDAIVSRYPQPRYLVANLVGYPVSVFAFLGWILPERVMDAVLQLKA